jgi:hypothetical protein
METVNRPSRALQRWVSIVVLCALCFILLVGTAYAQEKQPEVPNVDKLIENVRQGKFTPAMVNQIVQLRAVQAIPVLKEQFAANVEKLPKQVLASALVRLGAAEDSYWNFLVEQAKPAVENDAPFPIAFDDEGKLIPRQLSPEFVAWANAKNLSPEGASREQVNSLPVDVTFVAVTGDPRGRDLLRRGLSSRNYFIQSVAAKGLAKMRDKESIPLIIAACKKAPAQAAELLARALVFMEDAAAQAAAETYIKDRQVLGELRRLSREKGSAGVF